MDIKEQLKASLRHEEVQDRLDWPYLEWAGHKMPVPDNVIVDIDHCLSHAYRRDGLLGEWDDYHAASIHDKPIQEMRELLKVFGSRWTIVAITARPEKWRLTTMNWLTRHGFEIDTLLMRPNDCYDPSCELKVKLAKAHFGEHLKEQVAFIIDDKDEICAAFRAVGISSLQILARVKNET